MSVQQGHGMLRCSGESFRRNLNPIIKDFSIDGRHQF